MAFCHPHLITAPGDDDVPAVASVLGPKITLDPGRQAQACRPRAPADYGQSAVLTIFIVRTATGDSRPAVSTALHQNLISCPSATVCGMEIV